MAREYVSTTEAAEMLGVCWKTIYNYLKKGQLTGEHNPVSKRWKINKASIEKLINKGR
ncbi:MAG: helix-turn-helix domain-containing protein [Nitrospiraceae bacterium]|nr:helix-turn-helix domain-containing protein [Nitrospiraceae bacterium]